MRKITGCDPGVVIDTKKSGLILKYSDSGSVVTILNWEAMCRDHKLRVSPVRWPEHQIDTSGSEIDGVIVFVHKLSSR